MNSTTATRSITARQLFLLHVVRRHSGANTHQICDAVNGWHQAYESSLRDRLFTLEAYGLVKSFERKGRRGQVVARTWHLTQVGLEITSAYPSPKYDSNR